MPIKNYSVDFAIRLHSTVAIPSLPSAPPRQPSHLDSRQSSIALRSVKEWNELSCKEFQDQLLPDYHIQELDHPKINHNYVFTLGEQMVLPLLSRPAHPSDAGTTGDSIAERPKIRNNRLSVYKDEPCTSYAVRLEDNDTIAQADFEACFRLVESRSAATHQASYRGWSAANKREEIRSKNMRFFLSKPIDHEGGVYTVQALLSFMFNSIYGRQVLYVYEFHGLEELGGKGIGTWMMKLVERIAGRVGLKTTMLTAFLSNEAAIKLYKRFGYSKVVDTPEWERLRDGGFVKAERMTVSK